MACTTILVGKKASYDGSTLIARNEDCGAGGFTAKKFVVVQPKDQPRHYKSKLSHVEIELPDNPQRYTAIPDSFGDDGIWAAAGVNEHNVAMTATETITSNERVLGADPLVELEKAEGKEGEENYKPEKVGGIGEEDIVTLVLPYISSAREGVLRLGEILATYGTYEMNGIAFSDVNEIWWLETIGGHHWIAARVPDDSYVVMPNQFGLDNFDFADAEGAGKNYLCSSDLRQFVEENHLYSGANDGTFNPRLAFGSNSDADHVYNTPRAWAIHRYFAPSDNHFDDPSFSRTSGPESDLLAWSATPETLITIEDMKYALSMHYQGTPYDPYMQRGDKTRSGFYRPIGIARNSHLALIQLRGYMPEACQAVEWICYADNTFNAMVPMYANVNTTPKYLAYTPRTVTTESYYWTSRIIAALSDSEFHDNIMHVEDYQLFSGAAGHKSLIATDKKVREQGLSYEDAPALLEKANEDMANDFRKKTEDLLAKVLNTTSLAMKDNYKRYD